MEESVKFFMPMPLINKAVSKAESCEERNFREDDCVIFFLNFYGILQMSLCWHPLALLTAFFVAMSLYLFLRNFQQTAKAT